MYRSSEHVPIEWALSRQTNQDSRSSRQRPLQLASTHTHARLHMRKGHVLNAYLVWVGWRKGLGGHSRPGAGCLPISIYTLWCCNTACSNKHKIRPSAHTTLQLGLIDTNSLRLSAVQAVITTSQQPSDRQRKETPASACEQPCGDAIQKQSFTTVCQHGTDCQCQHEP